MRGRKKALASALAAAPLDLADVWALVARYGVHGLLHAGHASNWSAQGAGAALGAQPRAQPQPWAGTAAGAGGGAGALRRCVPSGLKLGRLTVHTGVPGS